MARLAMRGSNAKSALITLYRICPAAALSPSTAVVAGESLERNPLAGVIATAQRLTELMKTGSVDSEVLQELEREPHAGWIQAELPHRLKLFDAACEMGRWAAANCYLVEPWKFLAHLEAQKLSHLRDKPVPRNL
jgi:hypothetical protein